MQFLLLLLLASPALAQVELPDANQAEAIVISAEAANRWQQGAYEVWVLRGNCRIVQGPAVTTCNEAVLWIDYADATTRERSKVIAYLEGNVVVRRPGVQAAVTAPDWFGRFFSARPVQVQAAVVANQPDVLPGIYQRGMERRNPAAADVLRRVGVEPAQFTAPQPAPPLGQPLPRGARRVRAFPRGDVPVQAQWFPDPQTGQWVAVIDQGVNLVVDGVGEFGKIDVSTDRLVIWSSGRPDLTGQTPQDKNAPFEIYMEGNIVFREGERLIYANRMYYDVRNEVGTILDAEMLTNVKKYEGLLRLHAQIVQQLGHDRFLAENAFLTSSRFGVPGYRLQSSTISFEDIQHPVVDPYSGQPAVDPFTYEPLVTHERLATARNSFLYLEELPVFYWPVLATDVSEPSFYLRRIRFKTDNVMGTQVLTNWNVYQLLGIRHPPQGTDWDLSLDYLSQRGFGHGMKYSYHGDRFFSLPGPVDGLADYWGIFDNGFDVLGADRPHVTPEVDYRYRFYWHHQQQLPDGYQIKAEVGKISDRNFLQEYFKQEWDDLKDESTDIELKRLVDNSSWSISAQAHLDNFFTETQWLPRFDHFWLGQPLLDDRVTWFEHSSLGYAQFRAATLPNPALGDVQVSRLPWEPGNYDSERFITRHEFDLPVQLGAVKVVPYVLGELGHWGQDLEGNQLNRAYYQAGLRASLPMWRADPTVESALWNVHGLAHKVDFEFEFYNSQANRSLTELPLYDQLDDNAIENFRRRFVRETFGLGPVLPPMTLGPPIQFDERLYALRTGMAGNVTAPSMEIADNMTAVRAGVHQRWQTKRGMPDDRHIVDWVELNSDVTFYPNADRDNFGTPLGLWDYDFRWHVGDRLTLMSDGIFDFFDNGQKIVNVGAFLNHPPRGSLYVGAHVLEGPINSEILTFSYNYVMSPKWISSYTMNIDLANTKNFGQMLRIIRIGESMLVGAGFTYDPARSSLGAVFFIEPRFLPSGRLGPSTGTHIPPAGAYGLE